MKIINVLLLLILTGSCNTVSNNDKVIKQIELNKSDAIKLHDELMVEMGQLHSLKKRLQEMALDSLANQHQKINFAIAEIDKADTSMWNWMHNFDVTYANENDSVTLKYYETKLSSIEQVKLLFDSAILRGNRMTN